MENSDLDNRDSLIIFLININVLFYIKQHNITLFGNILCPRVIHFRSSW